MSHKSASIDFFQMILSRSGLITNVSVCSSFSLDTCRILEFTKPLPESAFEHHVIQWALVDNNDQCELKCYMENSCLSYNLGMLPSGEKLLCELSDSDHYQHPGDLVLKKGFSYHSTAVSVFLNGHIQVCRRATWRKLSETRGC